MDVTVDKNKEVQILRNYIEENIRSTKGSGLEFIDQRKYQETITNKKNHVVFGRRGAGKSSLLIRLVEKGKYAINIDIEEFKDITFPNIIVQILIKVFSEMKEMMHKYLPFYRKLCEYRRILTKLSGEIEDLEFQIGEPDDFDEEIRTKESGQIETEAGAGLNIRVVKADAKLHEIDSIEIEKRKNISSKKITHLRNRIGKYKEVINEFVNVIPDANVLFLIFDDFYFVNISDQPYLLDFFHRLTKNTSLSLKVATIRHRSKLFKRSDTFYGIELDNDAMEIDLDYTLDQFASVKNFLNSILNSAINKSATKLEKTDLFSGDGFNQLCIASGGVPRDFLTLLVKASTKYLMSDGKKIGKVEVTEEAIANISNKYQSIRQDTTDDPELIELFIEQLREGVYRKKRTNCFLVAKSELNANILGRQAINDLFDLRLIHLVDKNTSSAPSDGRRYEAYIIDVGLYDNARPRQFNQIDPSYRDDRARRDELRSSPILDLNKYYDDVQTEAKHMNKDTELEVTIEK